jgi:hypothetical protein
MSAILVLIALTGSAAADSVPHINIVPSCRAASVAAVGLNQDYDSCRRSEEDALAVLKKEWASFAAADRGSCYRLTTTGTPGTYTELLTCLEMKRDARRLKDEPTTVGRGSQRLR